MPANFPARAIISPSLIENDLIVTMSQASAFMSLFGGRGPRVKLGPVDKAVVMNALDIKTSAHVNQATHNKLPAPFIVGSMLTTATYTVRNRADWSEFDEMEAATWNVSLPNVYDRAMDQGIFVYMRTAALYGVNPANGEGLMNTPNATAVTLPPDTYGNTSITTYDNGQLGQFFQQQIGLAEARTFQMGMKGRVVMLMPQRVFVQMGFAGIVQTTSYQRPGAGTGTTAQQMKQILDELGYELEIGFDDTLIGKGAGGTDAIIIVLPELSVQSVSGFNTNEFASVANSMKETTLIYTDMARPRRIRTPIPEGVDVTSTIRTTSGWAPRGQVVTIVSAPY